ncbi:hypothetical protein WMY93_009952 [Mugilogobius chulae]|uniref:Uncharacterized protein n=1 Tax=Mugilogobius chulae TaxID=88201 RepID=A0AAW0P662_9GOBI
MTEPAVEVSTELIPCTAPEQERQVQAAGLTSKSDVVVDERREKTTRRAARSVSRSRERNAVTNTVATTVLTKCIGCCSPASDCTIFIQMCTAETARSAGKFRRIWSMHSWLAPLSPVSGQDYWTSWPGGVICGFLPPWSISLVLSCQACYCLDFVPGMVSSHLEKPTGA